MALFRRKRPKSFEGSALASCRRLRPDADWKHERGQDRIVGDGITINLQNLRLIWEAKDEGERAQWLEGHLSEVLYRVGQTSIGPPIDSDIRAMIRPRILLETSRLEAMLDDRSLSVTPPYRTITEDLVGVIGVDSPTSIALVSDTSIQEWSTTFDALWDKGIVSLRDLPQTEGWAQVNNSVFVSGEADDYTNSRLLVPEYLDQLQINGPAVVLLPHRNSLIVAPLIDDEAVVMACDLALQQLNEPSPICIKPFIWSGGEMQPLQVGDTHPAHGRVALLRLIDDDINYKQVVPQLAELLGGEVLIGGFYVDQQRLISSTNWGPTPALLPRTDEIVFIDKDTDPLRGMVTSWEAATDLFGDQMLPTDHYPPRFRVEGLPDVDAIRSISQPVNSLSSF